MHPAARGCRHSLSANTFNWVGGCCTLGRIAPKAFSPSLLQESNSGKSRSNGSRKPKKSPWAMTWQRSCLAGSQWSTASPTMTPSWMIMSGQTEGPRGWAGAELPSSVPGVYRRLPQRQCQQARAALLIQELCFYTMLKTLRAAAARVGDTLEAVRPEISSTFMFNDFKKYSEGRLIGLLQIYT